MVALQQRLVESLPDLASLAGCWQRLPGASLNPLLSHDWFCSAAATLHSRHRLQVATIWRGANLVAAAPLVEIRRRGIRWLEFLGSSALYEPCDVLASDAMALDALADMLSGMRRPLALQRVPAGGGLRAVLAHVGAGYVVPVRSAACRRVDMRVPWREYLAGRSSECRGGFPRKRRRLAASGPVAFESAAPAPEDVPALLAELVRVEAAGWKGKAGSALAQNPAMTAFFSDLSRRFAARRQVRFALLRCGGRVVAAQLGLEYGNRLWELKIGYDEHWQAASPGRLLLWEVLQDAFERGLQAYEFLGSGDDQQDAWRTSEQALETLVCYPYSAGGAVAAATDVAGAGLRRVQRVLAARRRR